MIMHIDRYPAIAAAAIRQFARRRFDGRGQLILTLTICAKRSLQRCLDCVASALIGVITNDPGAGLAGCIGDDSIEMECEQSEQVADMRRLATVRIGGTEAVEWQSGIWRRAAYLAIRKRLRGFAAARNLFDGKAA